MEILLPLVDLLTLIFQELANYLKTPNGPSIGVDQLREDGFGEDKLFRCFVADAGDKLVGYALYYFNYSSWEGANIHLEDLYVSPSHRQKGYGLALWKRVANVAVARKCSRMDWVCVGWNKNSIEFYKSKGAVNMTDKDDWKLFRLSGESLERFVS